MEQQELIPHLFRTEYSRMAAVLCRLLGLEHIDEAEDIAGETFLAALESWPYQGIPANPVAWLYAVAKNKAKNHLARLRLYAGKVAPQLAKDDAPADAELDLSEPHIADSQLQMMFAICHPAIPLEAQVGLSLRILCGFGITEIANAFLSNKETISKRLQRAKEKLRDEHVKIEWPGDTEIPNRLGAVLTTLYLLFSEGYYSECDDAMLREDLCVEAMRLTTLLLANHKTNTPQANALLSLMCFQASRFAARKNEKGEAVLYADQDESLWNRDLIEKGAYYLNKASYGNHLTKYHIEAGIAYWHTIKADTPEKWEGVLNLYNHLITLEYSPVAALNRTYALSKARGKQEAIAEAEKIYLPANHYYHTLMGELYTGIDHARAIAHYQRAIDLAQSRTDRNTILKKIAALNANL